MKRILIIGASILQVPAIKKAKQLGYYVGVLDYNKDAVGKRYADEFFCVSTIDISGVVEVAKKFKPNGVMTLATDMPMRTVAKVAEVCNLPGITMNTAIKATDKGEMIKAFEKANVAHPWYYIVRNAEEIDGIKNKIAYPCIMKPIDSAGSRGVNIISSANELKEKYAKSANESRTGGVIVEEYLIGKEVSVEIMVVDSNIHILQITDKITTGEPHFVEMGHTQPSRLEKNEIESIKKLARRAVEAVGITIGPAHVEIMVTDRGPKMIELGARMGGDCITTHLVPLSTGIDMVEATIKLACGEKIKIIPKFNKGAAIRYVEQKKGVLREYKNIDKIKRIFGVKEVVQVKHPGDMIEDIKNSSDRIAFVIAQANTANEAAKICDRAISEIEVIID